MSGIVENSMTELEVDKLTSYDFITQVYNEVTPENLHVIGSKVETKSHYFQMALHQDTYASQTVEDIKTLVKTIFSVRKESRKWGDEQFTLIKQNIKELLHSDEDVKLRFNNFCSFAQRTLNLKYPFDFASELLYLYDPDKYWLWSKWMYDPKANTGSLLLVLEDGKLLDGPTFGNQYLLVGSALLRIEEIAGEIGIREPNTPPTSKFEMAIFLAAVFAVYMYTITRMRMTKEFNTILPKMLELIHRLLGIHRKKDLTLYEEYQ